MYIKAEHNYLIQNKYSLRTPETVNRKFTSLLKFLHH